MTIIKLLPIRKEVYCSRWINRGSFSLREQIIGSLYAGEEGVLRNHISKFGAQSVVEVGALARACGSKSSVSIN